ncbi:hypothetical protein [Kitasatospora sp. NPDC051914]|uniref:hypothetical protein n=1 Tax=Kitasatospora sp. NPDC051914 TaxID=3154945 RepID=UPI00343A92BA
MPPRPEGLPPIGAGPAQAAGCASYRSIDLGRYWVNNNTWDTHRSGDTVGWGTAWDLYVGDLDLNTFFQALVRRDLVQRTDRLSSVEAGTEAFTGRARLDTRSCSTTVG